MASHNTQNPIPIQPQDTAQQLCIKSLQHQLAKQESIAQLQLFPTQLLEASLSNQENSPQPVEQLEAKVASGTVATVMYNYSIVICVFKVAFYQQRMCKR